MTAKSGATEFRFAFSDTGGAAQLSSDLADARRIQNVLLGRRRAGLSAYGLDLKSYVMELADAPTLDAIQGRASQLVAQYCPGVAVAALVAQMPDATVDPAGLSRSVVVGAAIGPGANTFNFAVMAFQQATGTVVSSLVL